MKIEKNYDFRKKLLTLHEKGIRNPEILPDDSEVLLENGVKIILPPGYDDVILTAAKDLAEYLFVSQNVSAMIAEGKDAFENSIILSLCDEFSEKEFEVNIDKAVHIRGRDSRAVAQGIYYVEDLMTLKKAPILAKKITRKRPVFSPRMIHSGYGLDDFPNEHLAAMARKGIDAILVFTKGVDSVPGGYLDFNQLVYRAGKYGIDVYAYSYLVSEKHPDDEGAVEYYDNLYGRIFEKCPGLKGVVLVGESVEFPSKDENGVLS